MFPSSAGSENDGSAGSFNDIRTRLRGFNRTNAQHLAQQLGGQPVLQAESFLARLDQNFVADFLFQYFTSYFVFRSGNESAGHQYNLAEISLRDFCIRWGSEAIASFPVDPVVSSGRDHDGTPHSARQAANTRAFVPAAGESVKAAELPSPIFSASAPLSTVITSDSITMATDVSATDTASVDPTAGSAGPSSGQGEIAAARKRENNRLAQQKTRLTKKALEAKVETLESQLQARNEELRQQEYELRRKEEELRRKEQELREKDRELYQKNREIDALQRRLRR